MSAKVFLICSLFSLFSFEVSSKTQKTISDRAILRIEEKIYFASELHDLKQALRLYRCLRPKNLLWSFVNPKSTNWQSSLNDLILFHKIHIYLQKRNWHRPRQVHAPSASQMNSCRKKLNINEKIWRRHRESILLVDSYLKKRFVELMKRHSALKFFLNSLKQQINHEMVWPISSKPKKNL